MIASLGTIIIYARDMQKTAAFYSKHFGFKTSGEVVEGLDPQRLADQGRLAQNTRKTLDSRASRDHHHTSGARPLGG